MGRDCFENESTIEGGKFASRLWLEAFCPKVEDLILAKRLKVKIKMPILSWVRLQDDRNNIAPTLSIGRNTKMGSKKLIQRRTLPKRSISASRPEVSGLGLWFVH